MKIHEFQGKALLRQAGISVPAGVAAKTADEAAAAFDQLGGKLAVVKAQIHAGGRGKGTIKGNESQRGVELVKTREDAKRVAAALLGKELVTIQTGPEGKLVQQVLVEAGCDIDRELYLGIVVDRACSLPVLMVSANAHEYTPAGYQTQYDGFLTKPLDVAVLLDQLRRCLRLEWMHDAEPEAPPAMDASISLPPAARHHLEDLWQLGRIGHVRGIQAKLRDIENEDPGAKPVTAHLRGLVESFQMKRYMEVVGGLRAGD